MRVTQTLSGRPAKRIGYDYSFLFFRIPNTPTTAPAISAEAVD